MKIVMFHKLIYRPCRKPRLELLVADSVEANPGQIICCKPISVTGKEEDLRTLLSMLQEK